KVEKVRSYPLPTTLRQLRGFIGLASYYRKFIPGFAALARPLHHLLQKDVSFCWGPEQQKAFEILKNHLITAPVLKYPDFDDMFYLYTDASSTGLGAVLAQKGEGKKEHVISYTSRNYSACELECWRLFGRLNITTIILASSHSRS
ncbi:9045_t:CDS:1, partial [Dentiscutata erythropus]